MTRKSRAALPPSLPDGTMLFHQCLMPIERVERLACAIMRGFDDLPPELRFVCNAAPVQPFQARKALMRFGPAGAAA